jgi:hypothetical protein
VYSKGITVGEHLVVVKNSEDLSALLVTSSVSLAGSSSLLRGGGLNTLTALSELGLALLGLVALVDDGAAAKSNGVGVQLDQGTQVGKRVLLTDGELGGLLPVADSGLNLIGLDDARDVGVGEESTGRLVVLLLGRSVEVRAEDGVELLEGTLGEDDEATQVTTRSKLEKVQAVHVGQINTRDVAEGLGDGRLVVKNNQGTTTLDITSVAHLTLTSADVAGSSDALDIIEGMELLEESNSLLGLGDGGEVLRTDDQRDLGNVLNLVTTSHHEGSDGGGSQGGANSKAALVAIDVTVPSAPDLGGGEHATLTAHVTESSLAGAVSTTTTDTGNTGDSATSTPGLGRSLMTSHGVHGVGLTTIARDLVVDERNQITADGAQENVRESHVGLSLLIGYGVDSDDGTGSLKY